MAMRHTNISVPHELVQQVKEFIEEGGSGYTSVAEFTREAIRLRLEAKWPTPDDLKLVRECYNRHLKKPD